MLGEEGMVFGGGRMLRVLVGGKVWVFVTAGHKVVPIAVWDGEPMGIGEAWTGDAGSP